MDRALREAHAALFAGLTDAVGPDGRLLTPRGGAHVSTMRCGGGAHVVPTRWGAILEEKCVGWLGEATDPLPLDV